MPDNRNVRRNHSNMNTERRQFRRFLADDRSFACLRPHFGKLGKIKDISRGGLAFEYICTKGSEEKSSAIDIFLSGDRFYLPKMPCRVVYDLQKGEDLTSISNFQVRKCGLEFGELTGEQKYKLKLFLNTYSTGTA